MTGFIPSEIKDKANKMNDKFIKASEFEGGGLNVRCVRVEIYRPDNKEFGANEDNKLVDGGVLQEGESIRYVFANEIGDERVHTSTSAGLYFSLHNAEVESGDWVNIRREGVARKTRYFAVKTETQTGSSTATILTENEDTPF